MKILVFGAAASSPIFGTYNVVHIEWGWSNSVNMPWYPMSIIVSIRISSINIGLSLNPWINLVMLFASRNLFYLHVVNIFFTFQASVNFTHLASCTITTHQCAAVTRFLIIFLFLLSIYNLVSADFYNLTYSCSSHIDNAVL